LIGSPRGTDRSQDSRQNGGYLACLELNSALDPALALHESAGFEHETCFNACNDERAGVYRVYQENCAPSDENGVFPAKKR